MKYLALSSTALLFSHGVLAQIVGVAPKDQGLYVADSNNKWSCLSNPEIVLDFKQINDDYCDCPDGSDEPGTNACPNTVFYCENKGHIGGYIKGSLVNDGKCDYELCCDGSDEWNTPVECPNRCEEIHQKYADELKVKQKAYKIGSDKAYKTVRAAKRLRSKLEDEIESEHAILSFVSRELAKHEENGDELKRIEQTKHIEDSLKKVEGNILNTYDILIQSKVNLETLSTIIFNVVEHYNENLNDAAVALTVDRYRAHIDNFDDVYSKESTLNVKKVQSKVSKLFKTKSFEETKSNFNKILTEFGNSLNVNRGINERINDLEVILNYFIQNYNPNFNDPYVKESVQQYQDYAVNKPTDSVDNEILSEIKEEIQRLEKVITEYTENASLFDTGADLIEVEDKLPILDRIRFTFRGLLNEFLGTAPPKPRPKKLPTRAENNEFVDELRRNKKECEDRIAVIETELARDLGPQDILRPLEEIAINGKIGEYDYEVYFLKDLRQKGQNNHNVKIGTFDHYEVKDLDEHSLEWKLFYSDGAKCWNGPKRSAVVSVVCGETPELLSVSEPEKCEYHFRLKAPIGCRLK